MSATAQRSTTGRCGPDLFRMPVAGFEECDTDSFDYEAYLAHLARYRFACGFVKGSDAVADVGCGSGFGSRMMARHAARVCGLDHDPEAIRYCMTAYNAPNLEFQLVHTDDLGLGLEGCDVAVMMDVLQHVSRDCGEIAVARIKTSIADKGILVLSTPRMTPEGFDSRRKSLGHIHEYTYSELLGLLGKYFDRVSVFCQVDGTIAVAHPDIAQDFIAVCMK